jgi:hypothetical protein
LSILIFLCAVVSACSQIAPFEDRRREPGTTYVWVGASKPNRPAICYNPLFHKQENILAKADELCKKEDTASHAELVDVDHFSCRLFIPSKAYYKCVTDN